MPEIGGVSKRLQPGEYQVVAVRRHIFVLVSSTATALGAVIVVIGTKVIGESESIISIVGILSAFFVGRLIVAVADWYFGFFVLTSRRLFLPAGPFARESETKQLNTIVSVALQRSFRGRMLGYGDLVITPGGEHERVVTYIQHAEVVYEEISRHVQRSGDRP